MTGASVSHDPEPVGLGIAESVAGYEEVGGIWRSGSGLRAIVAIHSTALGPALGGTRFRPYPSASEALGDVLRLSKAMSYKAALAGLDFGGGKAVIIGEPDRLHSSQLLEDYASFLESFAGRYYTAEDVGTTQADMDELAKHTRYVTGRSVEAGGSGDPSPATAYGVFRAIQATSGHLWGTDSLAGRTIAISGVGKVGSALARLATEEGAKLVVADTNEEAAAGAVRELGATRADPEEIHRVRCDIYSPCALGGAINDQTVTELACSAVVGAANNQLARREVADVLAARGVAYVPDYVANAGGIINIAYERDGYDPVAAHEHVGRIFDTVTALFAQASNSGESLEAIADRTAEERMAGAKKRR